MLLKNIINTREQNGAALITALFFLIILTTLALSSMNMNIMDEKMASNSQQKNRLFQTAESALVAAINRYQETFSESDTKDNPFTATVNNLDADMTASYEAYFMGGGASKTYTKNASDASAGPVKRLFNITVNIENNVGAKKSIDAGIWILGPPNRGNSSSIVP